MKKFFGAVYICRDCNSIEFILGAGKRCEIISYWLQYNKVDFITSPTSSNFFKKLYNKIDNMDYSDRFYLFESLENELCMADESIFKKKYYNDSKSYDKEHLNTFLENLKKCELSNSILKLNDMFSFVSFSESATSGCKICGSNDLAFYYDNYFSSNYRIDDFDYKIKEIIETIYSKPDYRNKTSDKLDIICNKEIALVK